MSLAVRALEALGALLPSYSIRNHGNEYLRIHYLLGEPPAWADASWLGWMPFTIYLHHFERGDLDDEFHTHPWTWARSLILTGGYIEEIMRSAGDTAWRLSRAGSVNRIDFRTVHRIDGLLGDTWTLFVCGGRGGDYIARDRGDEWHFITRSGEAIPWAKFVEERH